MKDWDAYSATKAKTKGLSEGRASVFEYFWIKVIDNGLLVTIVILTVLFAASGVFLQAEKLEAASWFFDLSKLAFGVLLGMIAQKRTGK